MSAVDQTRLLSSFHDVAILIGSVKKQSDQRPEDIAKAVLQWLQSNGMWLLIFDNLDDISIIKGYLPSMQSSGHVLITTRNKNCDGIPAEGVEIIPMNSTESISLLLTRSGLQDDPRQEVKIEARKIADELGHLPLAIEQAAAYIRSSQNIFEYLSAYRQNRKDLLHDKPKGNYPYNESVATTWKMSLHRLETTSQKLIELLAYLNPDETLLTFLTTGNSGLPPELGLIVSNVFLLRHSVHDLEAYSLIRVWDEGRKITMHRLMQYIIRDDLDSEYRRVLITQVLRLGLSAFPDTVDGPNRQICRIHRSQVIAILANIEDEQNWIDSLDESALDWQELSERLAYYLFKDGYYSDSLKHYVKCVERTTRALGLEHPVTLRNMNNLAATFERLGRWSEAMKMHEECLGIRKRVLGMEHPDTLWSMTELAVMSDNLGRSTEAVKMHEECLEIRKRVLGVEHPDTLHSMMGLAGTYISLGRSSEAVKMHEECLEIRKRVLGVEHPDTLWSMYGLAAAYLRLGRSIEAVKMDEECLEIRKRVLGVEHPDTLYSMYGLAVTYDSLGRSTEAMKVHEECLEIRKRVLGVEHPDTLHSMSGLAATYNSLGRSSEAVKMDEECLEIRKRVLGAENPDTLQSMNRLAATYDSLGRWTEAMKVFEECLEIRKRVLGAEHPDTLWSMYGLAAAYDSLGRSIEAVKMDEECLEIRKRVLGVEHPDTLYSMYNLATTYDSLGRSTEAMKMHEECLEIRKRVLGAEHPDTLQSMNNLAATVDSLLL